MAELVSAKGKDVLAWRASGEFAVSFRQAVLSRLELCSSDDSARLLSGTAAELENLAAGNDVFCTSFASRLEAAGSCSDPHELRSMTDAFYAELYDHFMTYRSATAFYNLSTEFLKRVAESICRSVASRNGISQELYSQISLVALGPAGRQEFSPFCPLTIIIIYGDGYPDGSAGSDFCQAVNDDFETCGFQMDKVVTPCREEWRGTLEMWSRRMAAVLEAGTPEEMVDLLRLIDQTFLAGSPELAEKFRQHVIAVLSTSHAAVENLVARLLGLSNGIGIMGGLRMEKSGPFRGQFALLEHALQPLSAAWTALTLLKGLDALTTPQRIREILWRRELNVETAERLLQAWHFLNELRLEQESDVRPDWTSDTPLYLSVDRRSDVDREAFKEALEAVAAVQRHVSTIFNGAGA